MFSKNRSTAKAFHVARTWQFARDENEESRDGITIRRARATSLERAVTLLAMGFVLGGCSGLDVPEWGTWHSLVQHEWALPAGTEDPQDTYFTPDRDYLVTAIRPLAPPGTHHITLERPGEVHDVLWVSVLGTGELRFPEGVGLRLKAHEKLFIGYHLFNASSTDLANTSGIEVIEAEPGSNVVEANILTPSIRNFTLPPGPTTMTGKCTITEDQTFFAVAPHMHELGQQLSATLAQDGVERPVYDEDFNWDAQAFKSLPEMQVHKGDVVNLQCDWYNTTTMTVSAGGMANQEMCSAFIYRYPAGDSKHCTQ